MKSLPGLHCVGRLDDVGAAHSQDNAAAVRSGEEPLRLRSASGGVD